nr:hypothetical protein Iba_chr01bCG3170 [Ipomoea batatas]
MGLKVCEERKFMMDTTVVVKRSYETPYRSEETKHEISPKRRESKRIHYHCQNLLLAESEAALGDYPLLLMNLNAPAAAWSDYDNLKLLHVPLQKLLRLNLKLPVIIALLADESECSVLLEYYDNLKLLLVVKHGNKRSGCLILSPFKISSPHRLASNPSNSSHACNPPLIGGHCCTCILHFVILPRAFRIQSPHPIGLRHCLLHRSHSFVGPPHASSLASYNEAVIQQVP